MLNGSGSSEPIEHVPQHVMSECHFWGFRNGIGNVEVETGRIKDRLYHRPEIKVQCTISFLYSFGIVKV